MRQISKRTQVLMDIYYFQKENGRGIMFNELVDKSVFDRATVSKCHDSLSDANLIVDELVEINGGWSKTILVNRNCWDFVADTINHIVKQESKQ